MKNKTWPGIQYELSLLESCRTVLEDADRSTELKDRSEFLTTFLDTIPLPVFYKDASGKYLGCNKAFEHFIGTNRKDIIGRTVLDTWPKQFAERFEIMDKDLFAVPGHQVYQSQIKLSDGSKIDVLFHKVTYSDASGRTSGIIGLIQDVTELTQAIRSLGKSERDLKSILPFSTRSVVLIDISGVVIDINEVAAYRLKTNLDRWEGKNAYDLLPPDVVKNYRKMANKVISEGNPEHFQDELDGYAVLTSIYPVLDKDGKVEKLAIFGLDITTNRRTENALQTNDELYRSLTGTACDGYLYVDLEGAILETNETYCKMSGYTHEELLGMYISDLEANESYEDTVAHICRIIESGKDRFSTKHRTKNGKILDIEVSTTYSDKPEPGFFSFFKDITEHKQAEEREKHLHKVLLAIRKVSQLMIREKDPFLLIEQSCAYLTETLGYSDAWIVLVNENGSIRSTAASGTESTRRLIQEQLESGRLPFCMNSALRNDGIIVIDHPNPDCADCSLSCENAGMSGMASRLLFDGRVYGVLTVLIPSSFAYDKEEQELFIEMADDLGFVLQKINTEISLLER